MPAIATKLESLGATITHKWWETEGDKEYAVSDHAYHAWQDKRGVETADAVLVVNSAKSEGKAVEQGIALALDIPLFIVGIRGELSKNVFHYLNNYTWCRTIEDGIEAIIKHGVTNYVR